MPPEAVSLALAASIYPPAIAAVIALGSGVQVRLRVVLFVLAAYATVLVTGALMLFLFDDVGASGRQVQTPSAGVYLIAGVVLLAVAARMRRRRASTLAAPHSGGRAEHEDDGGGRVERYLQTTRLVALLGVVLYVVPSPIFAAGVRVIADQHASTAKEVADLAQFLVLMLWLIEVPMLAIVLFPQRAVPALVRINAWFSLHGWALLIAGCTLLGGYLVVVGAVGLT